MTSLSEERNNFLLSSEEMIVSPSVMHPREASFFAPDISSNLIRLPLFMLQVHSKNCLHRVVFFHSLEIKFLTTLTLSLIFVKFMYMYKRIDAYIDALLL